MRVRGRLLGSLASMQFLEPFVELALNLFGGDEFATIGLPNAFLETPDGLRRNAVFPYLDESELV